MVFAHRAYNGCRYEAEFGIWVGHTADGNTGPLEIYRVPGSVAFLHSGSLLHAILPRSQCWCVDGVSKFAMRVLPNTYYRIELPGDSQEDLDNVEQLKKTLTKVLYYERTACPFQRGFGEDLPELPRANSRRVSRDFVEPAKRWRLDRIWKPEGADLEEPELLHPDRNYYISDTDRSENEETGRSEAEESGNEQAVRPESRGKSPQLTGLFPPKKLSAMRSVTAPPQLSVESSPPSKLKVRQMAGRFDQAARETVSTPPRPALATLIPKLPPTPESMTDDRGLAAKASDDCLFGDDTASKSDSASRIEPSMPSENECLSEDEHDTDTPTEPIIIVEQPEDEAASDMPEILGEPVDLYEKQAEMKDEIIGTDQYEKLEEPAEVVTEEEHSAETPTTASHEELPSAELTEERLPIVETVSSTATSWSTLPVLTPSEASDLLRQRRGNHHQSRTPSPPPPTTSTPQKNTSLTTSATSPAHLVRKTCALFLGPPASLVATMLRIAARLVASGALNLAEPAFHDYFSAGSVSAAALQEGRLRGHRRVPGSWDLSDDDEDWGF